MTKQNRPILDTDDVQPVDESPTTPWSSFGKITLEPLPENTAPSQGAAAKPVTLAPLAPYLQRDLAAEDQQTVAAFGESVRSDRDYPKLHLAPPVGRLNDPNGLVYDGRHYHAFYQYSPLHPERIVYWRHAISDDLTHWEDAGTALVPNTRYDSHGCYSGSGIRVPGGFEFFYTGNVKDSRNNRETYQILATAGEDAHPTRQLPPLLEGPHEGYTAHYRDPYVFERDGQWWMVIGAQKDGKKKKHRTGAVVVYTSADRRSWDFKGELDFTDPTVEGCYMYECPSLLQLRDEVTGALRDVLIFSPQGLSPEGEKYQNIYQSGYIVGELDPQTLRFEVHTPFTELDAGFEFYAPQTVHGTGTSAHDDAPHPQTVMIGWLGNAEQDDHPSWAHRWVHMFTYPRELHLREGKIYQTPVPHLDRVLPLESTVVDVVKGKVPVLKDAGTWRLHGTVDVSDGPVKIRVKDAHGTALRITIAEDFAQLDRSGTRYTEGGTLRRRALTPNTEREFELLVDASSTELFVGGAVNGQDGAGSYEQVFSARTYFSGSKRRVRMGGNGEVLKLSYAVL